MEIIFLRLILLVEGDEGEETGSSWSFEIFALLLDVTLEGILPYLRSPVHIKCTSFLAGVYRTPQNAG